MSKYLGQRLQDFNLSSKMSGGFLSTVCTNIQIQIQITNTNNYTIYTMVVMEIDNDDEEKKISEYFLFQILQNPKFNSVDHWTGKIKWNDQFKM